MFGLLSVFVCVCLDNTNYYCGGKEHFVINGNKFNAFSSALQAARGNAMDMTNCLAIRDMMVAYLWLVNTKDDKS